MSPQLHRFEVSARAVNDYLTQQLEDLKQRGVAACAEGGSCRQPVVLLLHFGVDIRVRSVRRLPGRAPHAESREPRMRPDWRALGR